ncbi:MAG: hypothetical protein LBR91_01770 [Puniceicoccales bacterium]|nr:hypothetical protein [Puniceicoccales bacterium]
MEKVFAQIRNNWDSEEFSNAMKIAVYSEVIHERSVLNIPALIDVLCTLDVITAVNVISTALGYLIRWVSSPEYGQSYSSVCKIVDY